jgi:GntR family transcriptional regulator
MQDKVYRQIAEALENDIMTGPLREGMLLPSAQTLAAKYGVNVNTATHAVSVLTRGGFTATRNGIGVEILEGARERIREARQGNLTGQYIKPLVAECKILGVAKQELIAMIMKNW